MNGDENLLKCLLANGADVNAKEAFGRTPIFYAVFGGQYFTALLLLDYPGIDIQCTDSPPLPRLQVVRDHGSRAQEASLATSQCPSPLADQMSGIHDPGSFINLLTPFHGVQTLGLPSSVSGEDNLTLLRDDADDSEATAPSIRSYASDDDM